MFWFLFGSVFSWVVVKMVSGETEPSAETRFACRCVLGWCLSSIPGAGEAPGHRGKWQLLDPDSGVVPTRGVVYLLLISPT